MNRLLICFLLPALLFLFISPAFAHHTAATHPDHNLIVSKSIDDDNCAHFFTSIEKGEMWTPTSMIVSTVLSYGDKGAFITITGSKKPAKDKGGSITLIALCTRPMEVTSFFFPPSDLTVVSTTHSASGRNGGAAFASSLIRFKSSSI